MSETRNQFSLIREASSRRRGKKPNSVSPHLSRALRRAIAGSAPCHSDSCAAFALRTAPRSTRLADSKARLLSPRSREERPTSPDAVCLAGYPGERYPMQWGAGQVTPEDMGLSLLGAPAETPDPARGVLEDGVALLEAFAKRRCRRRPLPDRGRRRMSLSTNVP